MSSSVAAHDTALATMVDEKDSMCARRWVVCALRQELADFDMFVFTASKLIVLEALGKLNKKLITTYTALVQVEFLWLCLSGGEVLTTEVAACFLRVGARAGWGLLPSLSPCGARIVHPRHRPARQSRQRVRDVLMHGVSKVEWRSRHAAMRHLPSAGGGCLKSCQEGSKLWQPLRCAWLSTQCIPPRSCFWTVRCCGRWRFLSCSTNGCGVQSGDYTRVVCYVFRSGCRSGH